MVIVCRACDVDKKYVFDSVFFFNDTATTEIYTVLTHSFPTRRSSDLKAPLEHQGVRPRLAWPERARAMLAVERGRVDRFLQVQPMMQVAQKEDQRPLILLVAAGRAPGEVGLAVLQRHRWRQGSSEEHTSELQSLMRSSYAVFCLKKKKNI